MTGRKSTRSRPLSPRLQAQIAEVSAGRSARIDLSDFNIEDNLSEVPDEIRHLTSLQVLNVNDSSIQSLPAWLGELPNLRFIDSRTQPLERYPSLPSVRWGVSAEALMTHRNQLDPGRVYGIAIEEGTSANAIEYLTGLCREGSLGIDELSFHRGITAGENREAAMAGWSFFRLLDSRIDEILASQHGLLRFSAWGFPMCRIPEPVRRLENLVQLDLGGVRLNNIPDWIFHIPKLEELGLSHNDFTDLPDFASSAQKLSHLRLGFNSLTRIPPGVWKLDVLKTLDLCNCPIVEIPPEILRLKHLKVLMLGDFFSDQGAGVPAELITPPPEIAAQGLNGIKRYWAQRRTAGIDFLAEAKLLIVGEPGAGKTSLAKKILDQDYVLVSDEDSTAGIDVLPWEFPASIRVRDQDRENLVQRDFRVNIWDFGGQEIYHSTHQFFLTKRSVYVLVTDERKEDADFEYWLEVVNLLSDSSPLFIVQNRKQQRQQRVDFGALRQRYPNLRETLALDLADNVGLDEAIRKIRQELEQLPHIGTALPKTWRDVRVALEADSRNYISSIEFFEICKSNGFASHDDMLQLGGYLHDLGICLFFQDDSLLSRTVILKPTWGTSAVYRVLDDPEIFRSLGVFRKSDLRRIWNDPIYESMHDELLQLMVKFGLCYKVPGSDTFIAPQLLTPSQPTYCWDDSNNLVLRYEYDVMPKGIVRRLIVSLHDLIAADAPLWRNGVVFGYEDSKAEVVEQYRRRILSIRIRGGDPRVLLGLIEHELAIIHRSYPGIRFDKFMPCNCPDCYASGEPATFAISDLVDFARTGDLIQCRASRKLLDPAKLLNTLSQDISEWRYQAVVMDKNMIQRQETPDPPEVFISYKRGGASEALADELRDEMQRRGVAVIRDKDAIRYRAPIRRFMRRLGTGKCIIIVISAEYLRSKSCMFELTEIADHSEFTSRIFPIIMQDAEIFDAIKRIGYIKYWEERRAALDEAMRQVGQENLQGIREEVDLYEKIRNTIAGLLEILGDMNTLTLEIHRDDEFNQLYEQIAAALP